MTSKSRMTVRQTFYRLVSTGATKNSCAAYQRVSNLVKRGLGRV
jgi:hypothetical protein